MARTGPVDRLKVHAAAGRKRRCGFLLGLFGDHGFGRDEKTGNRRCVLKRGADDLGRVDDAHGIEIAIFVGLGIPAIRELRLLAQLADDDRALGSGVFRNLAAGASIARRTRSTPTR